MITLFCHPRPFESHFDVIQRNAIGSFKVAFGEVWAMGRNCMDADADMKWPYIRYQHDLPVLSHMFAIANRNGKYPIKCYCNSDIILPPNFPHAIARVALEFPTFLAVGRRTDVPISPIIQFDSGWWERVEEFAQMYGKPHGIAGIDYFCYRGDVWGKIPPFVLLALFDNWLVGKAIQRGVPVVDMTERVLAIHQNHGSRRSRSGKAMAYNKALVEGASEAEGTAIYDLPDVAHLGHCTWRLTEGGLEER